MNDFPAIVYGAIFNLITPGITAYNAAVLAGSLPGCPQVDATALDDRTTGKQQAKLASGAPKDFAQIRLSLAGGNEQQTTTPTFGLASGSGCDAIVPMAVILTLQIMYDGANIGDGTMTPLEGYISAALKAGYPKYGIPYCMGSTFQDQRKPQNKDGVQKTVFTRTITVNLRPHLSLVQAL